MSANMNTRFSSRIATIAAAATFFFLQSLSAQAAPSQKGLDALTDRSPASQAQLPSFAKANSGITGTLNPGALSAPVLDLTLADGTTIQARLQRVAQDSNKSTQSWVGTFDDSPGSVLVLTKTKGAITGVVNYDGQTLEIVPAGNGKHVLYAVDSTKLPEGDGVIKSTSAGDVLASGTSAGDVLNTTASTTVVQDVLILYTSTSAAALGQATLESKINSAVQAAMQAYQNSVVGITLNVVGLQQAPLVESGSGMETTLSNLKNNTTVRALRDTLKADMVVLISQDSNWCGYSNLTMTNTSSGTNTDAYSVVYSSCLSQQSFAHEVGHLQGLDHNRENGGNGGFYPYGYGYRVCVTGGWRDVMSYNCSGVSVPRVLQFSNPNVYYNGYVTGISYELDPTHAADTARAMNNSATTVAAYRTSSTSSSTATVPVAPSGLTASGIAYNYVSLAWTDNSSSESGFKVQRSGDGVNFTEIASLGAGTVSFKDPTPAANTQYYYRVYAYNSAGPSSYSNTLSVKTPSAPVATAPVAPSGLAASGVAYNYVTLGWSDNSTDETGFYVERSADAGVTYAQVASVGAGVVSFKDTTVAAKSSYYYRVRAYNSNGNSAYSNTLTVTTPDVPPAAPTAPSSVAAVNEADGTAGVSWAASTNASSYDVQREKWDSRKSVWTSTTLVATVPSTYTSIVDSSGAGTYRYSVRAKNTTGASAYAGPANVTVTAPTKGKGRK